MPALDAFTDELCFSVASENMEDLVSNHILNCLTCRFEILTGIEVIRMLCKVLTDDSCHCETDVGVDVDLADCELCCLSELIFGDTDCIRHISAVLVDHLYEFLRN